MPDEVQDVFGYALHLAQIGLKHKQTKPLKGQGSASVLEVVEDWQGDTYRGLHSEVQRRGLRAALLSEEGNQRHRNAEAGTRSDRTPAEGGRGPRKRSSSVIRIEEGSTNVYADLGRPDADEMLIKAQLATKIGEIIKRRRLTQVAAAQIIGMPQPKLSGLLRGRFRGISEAKMLGCLTRLGRDVRIVVGPARRRSGVGHIEVLSG
jgi:predicted XRE-type DNA-binding protein